MVSRDPTIYYIKLTKPTTRVRFKTNNSFSIVKLIDVKGIDSCIVYLNRVHDSYNLSNLDEVYPGDTIFLKKTRILGIYPSLFDNNVEGIFKRVNEIVLRITNLDGSEPEFKTPIILTIRSVAK